MSEPGEKSDHESDHEPAEVAKLEAPAAEPARTEEPAPEPPQVEEPAKAEEPVKAEEPAPEPAKVEEPARAEEPTEEPPKAEEPVKAEEPAPEPAKVEEPPAPPAPAPSIVGVEPACLSAEGGGVLTILGADFAQGCSVRIGDALVPSSWAHAGRLEAVSKKHAPGEASVVVDNPDGQRGAHEQGVRFAAPPHVEGVEPGSGFTTGGTEVTLRGSGFEPGCTAMIAGAPVPGTTFVSETEIRFVTPPHLAPGSVEIAVVNPTGLVHRQAGGFSFVKAPPRVDSVTPDRGPNAGGTELVVRGESFDEGAGVFVCGIAATVIFKSPDELLVTTPPVARDGLVDVRVVNADDQGHTVEKVFLYVAPLPPPELREVGPNRGSQAGGLQVALLGESFASGVTARFGGVSAAVRFLTGKELSATTPAFVGYGEVDVEVTNPDGVSSVLPAAFTYEPNPAPEIAGVTPAFGPTTGGTRVLIEGQNFAPGAAVYVGREPPKDLVVKSATEIQIVTARCRTSGVVDVEVAVPGAPKAVMKNGFRYDAVPGPAITSVSPTAGTVGGGTELTITGKNFTKESVVLVAGKATRALKLVDASTLELKTPPGESGKLADVIVRNPDGQEAVQKRAFLYDPRYRG